MESNGATKVFTLIKKLIGRSLLLQAFRQSINLVELGWDHQEVALTERKFFKPAWTKALNKFTSLVEMALTEVSMN